MPLWWHDPVPSEPLAPAALGWVDAVACYWAMVLMSEYSQLEWRRFDEGDPIIDIHNRPVLMVRGDDRFAFEPVRVVYTVALGVLHDDPAPFGRRHAASEPDVLVELHEMRVAHIERALAGDPAT